MTSYDEIYESDGYGELGSLMGFNLEGHLDFQAIEEFMATEASEWFNAGSMKIASSMARAKATTAGSSTTAAPAWTASTRSSQQQPRKPWPNTKPKN